MSLLIIIIYNQLVAPIQLEKTLIIAVYHIFGANLIYYGSFSTYTCFEITPINILGFVWYAIYYMIKKGQMLTLQVTFEL